jgi:hypothetical protein
MEEDDSISAIWNEYDLINRTPSMLDRVEIAYSTTHIPVLKLGNPFLEKINKDNVVVPAFKVPSESTPLPVSSFEYVDEVLFPRPVYRDLPEFNKVVEIHEPLFSRR